MIRPNVIPPAALRPRARIVLAELRALDPDDLADFKPAALQTRTGYNRATIRRAVLDLERAGFVRWIRHTRCFGSLELRTPAALAGGTN